VRIEDRVDKANAALADVVAGLVDKGEDGARCGGGGGGAVNEREVAVDGDDVVCAVGLEKGQDKDGCGGQRMGTTYRQVRDGASAL
jgi:hypothetical protein